MKAQKILSGHWLLRRVNRLLGLPTRVLLEITTRCNCMCANCRPWLLRSDSNFGNGHDMTMEDFDILLEKLPFIERFLFAGLGEPFLHPHLFEIIANINRRGKVTVVETNGTLLGKETCVDIVRSGLRKLCLSIDSANPDTFERLREGSHLQEVTANIRTMVETKRKMKSKTPHLMFIVTASRDNQGELKEIIRLAHCLEIPVVAIKKFYAPAPELEAKKIPASHLREMVAELKEFAQKLPLDLRAHFILGPGCQNHRGDIFVTVDGYVSPCHFMYYLGKTQFGNLFENDFNSVWSNSDYKQLRSIKMIREGAKIPEYCQACWGAEVH